MKKRPPRPPQQVSVRGTTFEALRAWALRNGTQPGKALDEILTKFLDEQARLS